jgi:hypothetical protein
MLEGRASPLTHAGSACAETLPWNTNVRGETHQAGAQRMKSISGPFAAAAVAAALVSFTAPAAEARNAAHGVNHGGGISIPYIGRVASLGSLRHGSIPNLAALRNGSIPNLAALRSGSIPHLGSHLGSLRRFGSIRELGSLRNLGSLGSIGSLGSLGGLGGFDGWFGGGGRDPRRRLRVIGALCCFPVFG